MSSCSIITACIPSTREGNVLTQVCVSVHTFEGGGVPYLRSGGYHGHAGLGWGYPIPGLDRGYPLARSGWWGVPQSGLDGGDTQSHVWTGGTLPGNAGLDHGGYWDMVPP